jgi:predicted TIM-barrel enzyme
MKIPASGIAVSPFRIGMLHCPVNSILAAPDDWKIRLRLPQPSAADWDLMEELDRLHSHDAAGLAQSAEMVQNLGFWRFLEDRALNEAGLYAQAGFEAMMLENIAAPYFVRAGIPAAIPAVLDRLAATVKAAYPGLSLGVQLLAGGDDQALLIAQRHRLSFIRTETALFSGIRPEGPVSNSGNLASLYAARAAWAARHGQPLPLPLILADLRKKHTWFPEGLNGLPAWLDSALFMKLEALVLTGAETGAPVDPADIDAACLALDKMADATAVKIGSAWRPLLLLGSGVTAATVAQLKPKIDGAIIGSDLKTGGFWENPLDPERLARFCQAWEKNG